MAEPAPRRLSNHKKLTRRLGALHRVIPHRRTAECVYERRRLEINPIAQPTIAPITTPSGPHTNPASGPWFALGMKIIGPKNPTVKPTTPNTTAITAAQPRTFI